MVRPKWTDSPGARRLLGAVLPAVGALLLIPAAVALGPAAGAATPSHDAGPTATIKLPDAPKRPVDVTAKPYGATPGKDTDDDSVAFRNAIGAARSGDEIVVPAGNYVFTTPNVVLKDGVGIRGLPGAVITTKFTSSSDNQGSSIFSVPNNTGNLTISGLRLTSAGGAALNNPLWIGSSSATNVSRIAVQNMQIDNYYKMAIGVRNGTNITIQSNLIKDALATGGGGEGYGIMIGYPRATNNRVANNDVQGPAMRHGILLQYSAHHNLVEGNRVSRTVYDAYDLHGEDEYSNELSNNVATDCGEGGFGVGNTGATHNNTGPNNWIHDNQVTGCRHGVQISRNSDTQFVENNTITGSTSHGISIHDEGASNVVLTGNTVRDSGADGIHLEAAPGVKVLTNTVSGSRGYALRSDAATTGYEIRGNDFRDNAQGVSLGSPDGSYDATGPASSSPSATATTTTTTTTAPAPTSTTRTSTSSVRTSTTRTSTTRTTTPRTTRTKATKTTKTTTPRTTTSRYRASSAELIEQAKRDGRWPIRRTG